MRLGNLSATLAVLIFMLSCASVPPVHLSATSAEKFFPVKRTSDECLVMIKTVLVRPSDVINGRLYVLSFNKDLEPVLVPNASDGFIAVKVREAGTRITSLESAVNPYLGSGEAIRARLNVALPYKPGELVYAEFTFVQTVVKVDQYHATCSYEFVAATDENLADLRQDVVDLGALASSWVAK